MWHKKLTSIIPSSEDFPSTESDSAFFNVAESEWLSLDFAALEPTTLLFCDFLFLDSFTFDFSASVNCFFDGKISKINLI